MNRSEMPEMSLPAVQSGTIVEDTKDHTIDDTIVSAPDSTLNGTSASTASSTTSTSDAHAAPSSPCHWATIAESTFVFGMWMLYHVYRLLGRWPFRVCLTPVVLYYWLTSRVARASSLEYLRHLHATHHTFNATPGLRHSVRHFMNFAEVILDTLLIATGRYRATVSCEDDAKICERVRQEQQHGQQPGQGGILITAHIGCIALCRALAEQQPELRLTILVHTRHAERFNRMLRKHVPNTRVRLMQVTDFDVATALQLADRIAQGEYIAIAGDRVPVRDSKIIYADFLGRQAPLPAGPYIMAAVLKCPLVFMGCIHDGTGYTVRFVPLAEQVVLPRQARESALTQYAGQFAAQMEACLLQAPYDWFNFFPFWTQANTPRAASVQRES